LDGRGIVVRFPVGARDFSILHSVHTGPGDRGTDKVKKGGATLPLPTRLHGMALNKLNGGKFCLRENLVLIERNEWDLNTNTGRKRECYQY
jgi:hypothetical protein